MMFKPGAALLFLTACFYMGCGPIAPPKNAYTDAVELLTEMNNRLNDITSFRISGNIDHRGDQRIKGKVFLFSRRSTDLRIELLSPFGTTISTLAASDAGLSLFDQQNGHFYVGKNNDCTVARLIGAPLRPLEVNSILLGGAPLIDAPARVSWNRRGTYDVVLENESVRQNLVIRPHGQTLTLERISLFRFGKMEYDVTFSNWQLVDDHPIPFDIGIKMSKDRSLLVTYDDNGVELNVTLPNDAFTLSAPVGFDPEPLICN